MVSQYIWIGIAIGVFFAGLGIGYAALYSTQTNFMHMTPQQMQQMMNNPQMMNQWHQTMMNDPQAMNNWMNTMMNNPQYMNQMMGTMMQNPQFGNWMVGHMMNNPSMMNNMMTPMMNDPQFSQQMYGMMFQNPQFMQNMMNNTQFQNQWMMNQNMMGSGMMNYGMMGSMMGTPITKQSDVITTINKIESMLDQVSSSYRSGDKDIAMSLATSAYLENYEYIESAIATKDLKQMEKIENMLRVELRSMIQNEDSVENINAKIDSIKENLEDVKILFQ